MPSLRSDSHKRIKAVENEFKAVRTGVNRLQTAVAVEPTLLEEGSKPAHLNKAVRNLEGTYLVRLFAEFESALRSYDQARHNDPDRETRASILIDQVAGRRGQGILDQVRQGAHSVRRLRNDWAHQPGAAPLLMPITEARARLQVFLSWLPEEWG